MGDFDQIHKLIAQAASGVIEQVTQQPTEAVFEDTRVLGDILVKMDFTSKFKGIFWYVFDRPFCNEVSAGFSGMTAEDLDEEMVLDTMKEICNMMSSSILLRFDSKGNFKLSVPEVFSSDDVIDKMGEIPAKAQNFLFKVGEKSFNIFVNLDQM